MVQIKTFAAGYDFGNSETCMVLKAGSDTRAVSLPSVTAQADQQKFHALGNRLGEDDYLYSDDTLELYVGKLALEQSLTPQTSIGDIERYASRQSLYLLLTAAASLLSSEREFLLQVVTGLPIRTFLGNEPLRRSIAHTLNGSHSFQLNGKNYLAHVEVKRVMMEGAGALILHGLNSDGLQAVLDIGGRTTDLYVTRGQKPVTTLCTHEPLGVEIAMQRVSAQFEQVYGRPLGLLELRDLFRAEIIPGYPRRAIYVDGSVITEVSTFVRDSLTQMAHEIASFVARSWNVSESGKVASNFEQVLLIGGGAYYFAEEIKRRIRHVKTVPQPEMANARGYTLLAQRLSQVQSIA